MWANIKTDTDQLDQVFDLDGFFNVTILIVLYFSD